MEKLIAREEVERIQAEFGRILKKKVDSKCESLGLAPPTRADEQSNLR